MIVSVTLMSTALFTSNALAQRGIGRMQGVARQATPTVTETIVGTVSEIKIGPCEDTTGRAAIGVHLLVATDDETTVNVHLGPQAVVDELVGDIVVGQEVTIVGFRTADLPEDSLVAKSIDIDGQIVEFRQDSLRPIWAAGAGRGQGFGQGRGQVFGPAYGQGRGQGFGQGYGQGRGNGQPCWRYQSQDWKPAMNQAGGRGMGQGRGRGMQGNGYRGARGNGQRWAQ
ncbi:hypothetical protein Pan181_18930 [Aeoliella mucimassa]|uniref:Magnetosome protein MamS/MamX domain-containing protein n=2 Tax=Aeoliella mucimassa TaxID=2527972 RepID=A0A518ALU1_9BACT|nr:hypothetical protein Pan181_18930 [Aeoliella mucimassa]